MSFPRRFVLLLLLAGCLAARGEAAREIRVAAAADLQFVLPALAREFAARQPGFRVQTSHAASGSLFAQIRNGAPYDVFLSADLEYPRRLAAEGVALDTNVFTYALGRLVIWAPKSSPLDPSALGHRVLLEPSVRRIAIANPRHAPTGAAALAALRALGIQEAVEPRLVHGENVAQAAQFVQSGAADLGLLTLSLALAPSLRDTGRHWVFPSDLCPPLAQGGIVLRTAREPAGARAFRDFLLGPDGRAILARSGLEAPARP
jgi:molybdate transport system substrate-binding protein